MKRERIQSSTMNGQHPCGDPLCSHDHHGHTGQLFAQIREYKNSDYTPLREIWEAGSIEIDDTDTPAAIARNIRTRPRGFRVFVVDVQDSDVNGKPTGHARVAGGVTLTFDGRRAYVYHFAVHPDFRGMGLGRALLVQCEKQALEWGALHLRLTARVGGIRAVAQKLYTDEGWTPTPEQWVYVKNLKPARRLKARAKQ
jgi:GNAT superfamily N-acetyltransferase